MPPAITRIKAAMQRRSPADAPPTRNSAAELTPRAKGAATRLVMALSGFSALRSYSGAPMITMTQLYLACPCSADTAAVPTDWRPKAGAGSVNDWSCR